MWFPGFCGFSAQAQHVAGLFHLALTPTHTHPHTHTKHSMRTYTRTHRADIRQLVARSFHLFLSHCLCVSVCKVFFSHAASCWQMQNFNLLIYCSDTSLKNTVTNTATHTRNTHTDIYRHCMGILFSCRLKICCVIFSTLCTFSWCFMQCIFNNVVFVSICQCEIICRECF